MGEPIKIYGYLKDGTLLTDETAKGIIDSAFIALHDGKGRIVKLPGSGIRIKTSILDLPKELQEAAFYR